VFKWCSRSAPTRPAIRRSTSRFPGAFVRRRFHAEVVTNTWFLWSTLAPSETQGIEMRGTSSQPLSADRNTSSDFSRAPRSISRIPRLTSLISAISRVNPRRSAICSVTPSSSRKSSCECTSAACMSCRSRSEITASILAVIPALVVPFANHRHALTSKSLPQRGITLQRSH
jgi:hypothetical protein